MKIKLTTPKLLALILAIAATTMLVVQLSSTKKVQPTINTLPNADDFQRRLSNCLDENKDYICAQSLFVAYFEQTFDYADTINPKTQIQWLSELYPIEESLRKNSNYQDQRVFDRAFKLKELHPTSDAVSAFLLFLYSQKPSDLEKARQEAYFCTTLNPSNESCRNFLSNPENICDEKRLLEHIKIFLAHSPDVYSGAADPLLAKQDFKQITFAKDQQKILFRLNTESGADKRLSDASKNHVGQYLLMVYQDQVIDSKPVAQILTAPTLEWQFNDIAAKIRIICR